MKMSESTGKTRIIAFDYDGVIVDSTEHLLRVCGEVGKRFGMKHPPSREVLASLQSVTYQSFAAALGVPSGMLGLFEREVFVRLSSESELPSLVPGIEEVVQRASMLGRAVIVSSGIRAEIEACLRAHELETFISEIFDGADPRSKEEKLRVLVSNEGVCRESSLMIGDSRSDIRAAKGAGIQSVGVSWGVQPLEALLFEEPTFLARRPQEILAFLEGRGA